MSNFGDLLLVVGDSFLGSRAVQMPEKFKKILTPGKLKAAASLGNMTRGELAFLGTLAPEVHAVRGEYDREGGLPDSRIFTLGGVRFGVVSGHGATPREEQLRALDVDVLLAGGSHALSIVQYKDKCIIDPGSLTGAFTPRASLTGGLADTHPSFVLLNITPSPLGGGSKDVNVEAFSYEYVDGDLRISRSSFVVKR